MNTLKICWIKNKKNKALLVPIILITLLTIGMSLYSSFFPMKLLILNFNIIIPLVVASILKATFSFEEHNNNFESIKLINRKKWLTQLNINNILLFLVLLSPLLFIVYLDTNNVIVCLCTSLTGIFWIAILSTIELILNSNFIIIMSCLFIPIIAIFGITNSIGNWWIIFPFLFVFHTNKNPILLIILLIILTITIFIFNNILIRKIEN